MDGTTTKSGPRTGSPHRRPGVVLAFLAAALIAVTGGVPLAQRLYAHLVLWSAGLGTYGTPAMRLVLLGVGVSAAVLAYRSLTRPGGAGTGHPRN
jgi:hypothetical protein